MRTGVHSGGTGNRPAFPHAMVLTAYFALSLVTSSFLPPSPRGLKGFARPVGPPKPPRDLTPATDARTTRLRRPRRLTKKPLDRLGTSPIEASPKALQRRRLARSMI